MKKGKVDQTEMVSLLRTKYAEEPNVNMEILISIIVFVGAFFALLH